MTPDTLAQLLMATLILAAWAKRRAVVRFLDDLSDGNVERLERIDRDADEARAWLAALTAYEAKEADNG